MSSTQEIELFEAELQRVLDDPRLIERTIQQGKEAVQSWLPYESLAPMIWIAQFDPQTPDKFSYRLAMVSGDFNGPEKRAIMEHLGRETFERRSVPVAIMMASEVWSSKNMLTPDGSRRYALPEDDPERRELITIQLLTAHGKGAVTACVTERKGGLLHLVGEWEPLNANFRAGLLSRFFFGFLSSIHRTQESSL